MDTFNICKCGCKEHVIKQDNLYISGHNISNLKHGLQNTRLYHIWESMKQRCLNSNNKRYKDYGGRGITICDEWLEFIPFRDWSLSNGYADNLTIDRINNNGNYEPSNCRFLSKKENNRNRGCVKLNQEEANEIRELHNTGEYSQKELAEKYNIKQVTISNIINFKIWK